MISQLRGAVFACVLVGLVSTLSLSAAEGGRRAEIVIGPDSRVRVTPTTSAPYRSICRLSITFPDGSSGFGSGEVIGNRWIVTAAHVLYDAASGGYATVVVQPAFDGATAPFGTFTSAATYVHPNYVATGDEDFDYGLIQVNAAVGQTTGRLTPTTHPDAFFDSTNVLRVVGYPGDLTANCTEMYSSSGTTFDLTANLVAYQNDTFGGESGGAVLDAADGLVAVHTAGLDTGSTVTSYNQSARVNAAMLQFFSSKIDDTYDQGVGNDTHLDASDITTQAGAWLSSSVSTLYQWDQDYYKITVPAGRLRLRVECQFTHSDGNIDLELLDAAGAAFTPTVGARTAVSGSDDEIIECLVPAAGIYYIRVHGDNFENEYDLIWEHFAPPGLTLTPQAGGLNALEGGYTGTYTVQLTQAPTADVTVTASPDSQVSVTPSTLTFTSSNWNLPQTVTLTAVDDLLAEGAHTGVVTHTTASADGYYNLGGSWQITASLVDNDTPGVWIVASGGTTQVVEAGAGDTFTCVLLKQPTADVVVTVTPDSSITVTPTTLIFTAANWNVAQTVTVAAVDDTEFTGTRGAIIAYAISSGDTGYDGLAVATTAVTVFDNDAKPVKRGKCAIGPAPFNGDPLLLLSLLIGLALIGRRRAADVC